MPHERDASSFFPFVASWLRGFVASRLRRTALPFEFLVPARGEPSGGTGFAGGGAGLSGGGDYGPQLAGGRGACACGGEEIERKPRSHGATKPRRGRQGSRFLAFVPSCLRAFVPSSQTHPWRR